ncbi:hypothetical protein P7C70_g3050, partial [Phenoliferia sp. Uapishka_3]
MDQATVLTQAVDRLKDFFPLADPAYLQHAVEFHLNLQPTSDYARGKGKQKANQHLPEYDVEKRVAIIVSSVSHKIFHLNAGEYPITEWRQVAIKRRKRAAEPSSLASNAVVLQAWVAERERGKLPPEFVTTYKREVDHTLSKNKALCRLHALFPTVPISRIRDVLSTLNDSYLFSAAEILLKSPDTPSSKSSRHFWFPTPRRESAHPQRPNLVLVPPLVPTDLFRSPEYIDALTSYLHSAYPLVPRNTIRSMVADGHPFAEVREDVKNWRAKQNRLKNWISDFMTPKPSSSTPMSVESRDGQGWEEVMAEIFFDERSKRLAQAEADEELSRELNREWTDEKHLFTCGCCFDDVAFEDVGTCSFGEHFFCRSCVSRQVEEHVYGGAPLSLHPGGKNGRQGGPAEGTGVRCLSTEGCAAPFSHAELQRCLSPTIFAALEKRLGATALEGIGKSRQLGGRGETLVRCPFCTYCEVEDSAVLSRALPIWHDANISLFNLPWILFQSIIGLAALIALHLLVMSAIFLSPTSFIPASSTSGDSAPLASIILLKALPNPEKSLEDSTTLFPVLEPHRVAILANNLLTNIGRRILLSRTGGHAIFQCRNGPSGKPRPTFASQASEATGHLDLVDRVWGGTPSGGEPIKETCGRQSCITCQRVYVEGFHRCYEDEKEGMRLAVEKAMSDAVKRNCPACGVAFQKESGCNKVIGMPCQSCTKCSLWQNLDDNEAVVKAANQARQAWSRDHPSTTGAPVIHQTIGPATMVERAADQLSRMCELLLAEVMF